jgi:hypothetical protein
MNRTTKVAVALIVAAGLSTMVYALPEQRAMAYPRLHLLSSDSDPDDFPFGPNSPDPPLSASKSDPPPSPPGITTQNLSNGAVTNSKLAPGSVSSTDIGAGQVTTPNIADQAVTTPKSHGALVMNTVDVIGPSTQLAAGTDGFAIAVCPPGTVVTGGGYFAGGSTVIIMHTTAPNNWLVEAIAGPTSTTLTAIAKCASIHQGE